MATNYPSSLDTFDTIASDKKTSDTVGGRTHRDMHNDLADAVEAVQAELGTAPSASYATVKARLDALVAYAAKTGAYTATVSDHTLNVTSGTFTLDLPAASTCAGQSLKVKNSGTGVVTLDGNSSETVEGVATFPLGPGSYVEITSTGSAWILTAGVPDTGWRNVTASLDGTWAAANPEAVLYVRRIGASVSFTFRRGDFGTSTGAQVIYTAPTGFRAAYNANTACWDGSTTYGVTTAGLHISGASVGHGSWLTAINYWADLTAITNDAWPTSLPGTAL